MRCATRGNITYEERWALPTVRIRSVVQGWHNRHAPDRAYASRIGRSGKDAVDETGGAMGLKRCEMRIQIHTLGLPLLLINICDPDQRGTASL